MTTPTPPERRELLEHIEDVMMQLVIGMQKGKILPHDVHQEAIDLHDNIKRILAADRQRLIDDILAEPELQPENTEQAHITHWGLEYMEQRNNTRAAIRQVLQRYKEGEK